MTNTVSTRAITSLLLAVMFAFLLWFFGANIDSVVEYSSAQVGVSERLTKGFFLVLSIMAIGPASVYLAESIPGVESFVLATLFGLAGQQLLLPYVTDMDALNLVVNMALAVILLHAGLETSWENFKKLWGLIIVMSTLGVVITAVGMSFAAVFLGSLLGFEILQTVALLLGVYVASTDPAALLELFKRLGLIEKTAGVVVISESAVNDVVGATFALKLTTLVGALATTVGFHFFDDGYMSVLTWSSLFGIAVEMGKGVLFGCVGYVVLLGIEKYFQSREKPHGVDSIAVKVAGLCLFWVAYITHSGPFLAVFVMGLLFTSTGHVIDGAPHDEHPESGSKSTNDVGIMAAAEKAGNDKIDGILKPLVFGTLGAIVDFNLLKEYAVFSLALFPAFMLVRLVMVFICMSPFVYLSKRKRARAQARGKEIDSVADVTWADLIFTALCRETGIVPAALMVGAVAAAIPGAPVLTALGMGIILCTLIFCPMYKPFVARKLKLSEE